MLVIILFNVQVLIIRYAILIISNQFNLESEVDDLIFLNVQLFSVEYPTHRWEDTGSFNLDGAMEVAEDIAAPYTKVVFFQ